MVIDPSRCVVRPLQPDDFLDVTDLGWACLASMPPWGAEQLAQRLQQFADGQIVAEDTETGIIEGLMGTLIVPWSDEAGQAYLDELTGGPAFACHDPQLGQSLLVAELLVAPSDQEEAIHLALCSAAKTIATNLGLSHIRLVWRGQNHPAETIAPIVSLTAPGPEPSDDGALAVWREAGFAELDRTLNHLGAELPVYEWQNPQQGQSWQARFGLA